jgi:hypothetical protein
MSLASDLKRLEKLAYHRLEKNGALVHRFHALPKAGRTEGRSKLKNLYAWLFVPLTMWPIDVEALLKVALNQVEQQKPFTPELVLMMDMLPPLPDVQTQSVVAEHEWDVATGRYESSINAPYKFNPEFSAQWQAIKYRFKVGEFADHKGVIRRRVVSERSFRENWTFGWKTSHDRFREIFDAFCHRWHLYGMQGENPLLLKLSVNLTPYGTMIMIPGFWSFDPKRDINWSVVTRLHKSHGAQKQGAKMATNRIQQKEEERIAEQLHQQAGGMGLKGAKRYAFIKAGLKWDLRTDDRKVRKLLQRVGEDNGAKKFVTKSPTKRKEMPK